MNIHTPGRVHRFSRNTCVAVGVLWLAILVSGIGVVYSTHLSRQLFSELETKRRMTSDLHVEWGQYLLEQSTWAAYSRVERIAAEELKMQMPARDKIVLVTPP
jgi:cell division protein FtsL